jgi:preprotein translocase subunit SecE
MNAKAEVQGSGMDTAKLAVSAALLIAGIYAFYQFEAYSTLLRVIGLLLIVGAATWVAYQTVLGKRLWQFAMDSRMEVRKVVWPSRQETVQTTLIVFVMVLVMGILLWLFDMMLLNIVKALTGHGG